MLTLAVCAILLVLQLTGNIAFEPVYGLLALLIGLWSPLLLGFVVGMITGMLNPRMSFEDNRPDFLKGPTAEKIAMGILSGLGIKDILSQDLIKLATSRFVIVIGVYIVTKLGGTPTANPNIVAVVAGTVITLGGSLLADHFPKF